MRSLLDHQADGIEYTLHSHGIDANVAGGNISPRLIQFHIKLGAGVKYNRVAALADELALALGVSHCRITRDGYYVKIEVPRPDPVAVRLFPLMRNLPGELPVNSAVLGLDESGVPLLLRLDSPDIAHILVSGTTGSGKTVLARSMIASLALQNQPEQLKLLLIDPKGQGYRDFSGLPNLVCPIVTDVQDGLHRLKWAVRHLEKRDEHGIRSPLLVIFIDELADLIIAGGKEVEHLIARLTQRGREAGIHLVACTQKPSAGVVGAVARSNFPTRLVGRVVSSEEARFASGVAGSGADKLMGRGDFLLFARGEATRVQVAHVSPEEMQQTVSHLGGEPYGMPLEEKPARPSAQSRPAERQLEPSRRARGGGRSTEKREPMRQEFSRPRDYYEPDYDDEDDYSEQPQVAVGNKRRFRTASYEDNSAEGQGVAERLARYRAEIQQRRPTPPPAEGVEDEEDEYPYYNPAKAQREQANTRRTRPETSEPERRTSERPKTPARKLDLWDDLEDEPLQEEDEASFDDNEDLEGYDQPPVPPQRTTTRPGVSSTPPARPGVGTNKSGPLTDRGQSLLSSLKARNNTDSFKIGS